MSNRTAALYKLSSVQFAALELHIYLDTHPGDVETQKKYNEYMAATRQCLRNLKPPTALFPALPTVKNGSKTRGRGM